jgi:hypothetical protein
MLKIEKDSSLQADRVGSLEMNSRSLERERINLPRRRERPRF